MGDLLTDSAKYFSALLNLCSLGLGHIRIERLTIELESCLSALRGSLTTLTIRHFVASFSAFVTLVDHFPNLTTLRLVSFQSEPDEGPVPQLSRPLRGKLYIHPTYRSSAGFIGRLAKLDQEYEELVIKRSTFCLVAWFLPLALRFSPGTVKRLRLLGKIQPRVEIRIGHFLQLEELELTGVPGSVHELILSSITSTNLRKITFLVELGGGWRTLAERVGEWTSADGSLSEVVARLGRKGYYHVLEVELRLTKTEDDPGKYEFARFLPRFREKGIVTIVDAVHDNQVLHLSTTHER